MGIEEILEEMMRIRNDLDNLIMAMEHLEKKGEKIFFADPAIEEAVREVLGKQEKVLYSREVQSIEELDVRNKKVRDLEGIGHLVNLKELNLNWNQIQDISPLEGLFSLKVLKLWDNQVKDISPLSRLKRLEVLTLEGNRITNIEPLRNLHQLKMLWLRKNHIKDLSPLLDNQGLQAGAKIFLNADLFNMDLESETGKVIEELMARGVVIVPGS